MSAIEIVLGDFAPGVVRIRRSATGRPVLRLTCANGDVEDIALQNAVAGCAEHSEGNVSAYLDRWLRRVGQSLDKLLDQSFRHERVFVVVLHDGRKFVARSSPDVVADLKAMATVSDRPPRRHGDAGRTGSPSGFFSRFLPSKAS
ncbi:hypothetical protein [Prosthecodimorpha staleyi]|uniref:Uncharacterized protein n=1 Tax=Prosthecodimorpha staleyi TaxID=2840188 RepID=A0A947D305_9HYPH|nr:hypothetical protein [Prosthecodimorpha staleyi]MBT9290055.1 hypothetical protein [Prosthecodimorpha staleyi]